jgi:hypothetical protein
MSTASCRAAASRSTVRVPSRLFRRLLLEQLAAHAAGRLHFFGDHAPPAEREAFAAYLASLRTIE